MNVRNLCTHISLPVKYRLPTASFYTRKKNSLLRCTKAPTHRPISTHRNCCAWTAANCTQNHSLGIFTDFYRHSCLGPLNLILKGWVFMEYSLHKCAFPYTWCTHTKRWSPSNVSTKYVYHRTYLSLMVINFVQAQPYTRCALNLMRHLWAPCITEFTVYCGRAFSGGEMLAVP